MYISSYLIGCRHDIKMNARLGREVVVHCGCAANALILPKLTLKIRDGFLHLSIAGQICDFISKLALDKLL